MLPGILGFVEGIYEGTTKQLKPGSTVVFSVKSRNNDGTWTLLLGGKELSVNSETPLFPGERLRAFVRAENGKIFLKLLESEKLARHALTKFSVPVNKENTTMVGAMMKTGLPLNEQLIYGLMRQFKSLSKRDAVSARVLALLADKGLSLDTSDVETLMKAIEDPLGEKGGRGSTGTSGGYGGSGRERKRRDSRGKNEEEEPDDKSESEQFRLKVERGDEHGSVLALFNQIKGRHDHWLVVPFSTDRDEAAVLRMHIQDDTRVGQFTFSVYGENTWHFEVKNTGKNRRVVVYSEDKVARENSLRLIGELRKKLHNLSFEIDDTIKEASEFDPFVSEHRTDIQGVDTTV